MGKPRATTASFEKALTGTMVRPTKFHFQLFIAGNTRLSISAISNLKRICEEHLSGRYTLEVIDIYADGGAAKQAQILVVPTLIRVRPQPKRVLIGNLSDSARVLEALGISP